MIICTTFLPWCQIELFDQLGGWVAGLVVDWVITDNAFFVKRYLKNYTRDLKLKLCIYVQYGGRLMAIGYR